MRDRHKFGVSLLVIFTSLFSVLLCSLPASADAPLIAGAEQGFPPYLEMDANGVPSGFAVELLTAVAQEEQLDLRWQLNPWNDSIRELALGNLDVLPMMARSEQREKTFDFSDPILTSYDAVFVRRGENRVEQLDDFKKMNVMVVRNGLAHEYLVRTGDYRGLTLSATSEEAMRRFSNGEADSLLMSRLPGLLLIRQLKFDNIEALDLNVNWYNRVFSIAVTKGNAVLVARLNHGLQKVRENGHYDHLFERWIASADKSAIKYRNVLSVLNYVFLGAIFIVVTAGAFLWTLQSMVTDRTRKLSLEIEERKKAEEHAQISEQKFRGAFESTIQGMLIATVDGRLTHVNQSLCDILAYSEAELLGLSAKQLLHMDDFYNVEKSSAVKVAGFLSPYQGEVRLRNKNGELIWTQAFFSYVNNVDGSPCEMVAQFQDITKIKESEEKETQLKARLQQAEKMESIGRLTGGIAHDFNNILSSILGFTDLTLSKYGDELNDKATRYLTEVYSAGERARDLIAQMMAFSRKSTINDQVINVSSVVTDALKMLEPALPSSIQVADFRPMSQSHTVLMDPVNLHQIVMNLTINARDAMAGKGLLEVKLNYVKVDAQHCASCHQPIAGEFIELSVKDSGKGISHEGLQKIFDPFFTTKGIGEGTGMGLSVVHGIVHEHNGHISVKTSENNGSEFKVLLKPVSPETTPCETNREVSKAGISRARVLIVDDEPLVGDYLKELFESEGHKVLLCTDSNQAWRLFEADPMQFDALVTDQTMPGLLGSELAEKALAVRDDIRVILCTGYVDDAVELKVQGLNVTLLKKPIKPLRLLELVSA